jgi:hypothetical protein
MNLPALSNFTVDLLRARCAAHGSGTAIWYARIEFGTGFPGGGR